MAGGDLTRDRALACRSISDRRFVPGTVAGVGVLGDSSRALHEWSRVRRMMGDGLERGIALASGELASRTQRTAGVGRGGAAGPSSEYASSDEERSTLTAPT